MPDRRASFYELCASLTDAEICSRMCLDSEDLLSREGKWSHRVVSRVWPFQGFAEKEGLRTAVSSCYFENTPLREIAEAYDFVGLPDQATIIWGLATILDEAKKRDKAQDDISLFQGEDDLVAFIAQSMDWEAAEKTFFDGATDCTNHLALFIRRHLSDFESLDMDRSPVVPIPQNIGYLSSMWMWLTFAQGHEKQAPTLAQLKDRCSHAGLKQASPENYQILVTGSLSDLPGDQELVRYTRPGACHQYVIHVDGLITVHPESH